MNSTRSLLTPCKNEKIHVLGRLIIFLNNRVDWNKLCFSQLNNIILKSLSTRNISSRLMLYLQFKHEIIRS